MTVRTVILYESAVAFFVGVRSWNRSVNWDTRGQSTLICSHTTRLCTQESDETHKTPHQQ
jgi:hypothetical protein